MVEQTGEGDFPFLFGKLMLGEGVVVNALEFIFYHFIFYGLNRLIFRIDILALLEGQK